MSQPQSGGFGTRIFFIPNSGVDAKGSQVLKGAGYITINVKGAHYSSSGNLWQKIFGGSDKITFSTQIDYVSTGTTVTSTSIEEVRQIQVNHPYYFSSGRPIALKLPTDCDSIGMSIGISAIKNDNLSGALNILNSGELQGTLQLAPPALATALSVAGIVKKLLTNTDPQNSLQGTYAGKLSAAASPDPVRDYCMAQGTLILIYREAANDTVLDGMDASKLSTDGDGLKYAGYQVQNTYVMFQISYDELRGEDPSLPWSSMFADAEASLLAVQGANTDADKQKLWATAFGTYQQAVKALNADPSYTIYEKHGLSASHYVALKKAYSDNGGQLAPTPGPAAAAKLFAGTPIVELTLSDGTAKLFDAGTASELTPSDLDFVAAQYQEKLAKGNFSLPGGRGFGLKDQ